MIPYFGVLPLLLFKALNNEFSAPKIYNVLAGALASFLSEPD